MLSLVVGLPLGVGTFDNTEGGSTWSAVLAGSYISKDAAAIPGVDSGSVDTGSTDSDTEEPSAAAVTYIDSYTANYFPGMKINGIYNSEIGTDGICSVNVSDEGFYAEYFVGGQPEYSYSTGEFDENDDGRYWAGNEFAAYNVTFTDGGMYLELDESYPHDSRSEELTGYYLLTETSDPSVTGISFADSGIFPDSSQSLLTGDDLQSLVGREIIRYAKNEIYARHGRLFSSPDLDAYFHSKNWYAGTIPPDQFDESVLNETEKANIDYLQNYYENYYENFGA